MSGDSEFGLRIRPYLVTGGRTDVHPHLRVDSTVAATGRIDPSEIRADHAAALRLCARPASVAEIAAGLGQPVQVTKVLLSDLLDHTALALRSTPGLHTDAPDLDFWRWSSMDSKNSDVDDELVPPSVKIVIAGGFGVGKTTMIGSLSEIRPMSTEEILTTASVGHDDLAGLRGKTTTTVAADYGRITFCYGSTGLLLYLFGTPGQHRFWFLWTELTLNAAGAVVLADVRRLDDSFEALSFFEQRGIPFVVAINVFDDAHHYDAPELREALALPTDVPLVFCDARQRNSVVRVLIQLVEHAHRLRSAAQRGLPLLTSSGEPR